MKEIDFLSNEIYRRYGSVTRARGPFLYTAKNQRLTDMFQENGRAILGWGGGTAFTVLKNVLNRGVTGTYRTDFTYRLQKAVSTMLNSDRKIYLFGDKKSAMEAGLNLSPNGTSFYRPWSDASVDWSTVDAAIIEAPMPWTSGTFILAVRDSLEMEVKLTSCQDSFNTIHIPAPVEAAAARSIYNLIQALQEREEKDWFIYDKALIPYWERRGPYLYIRKEVISRETFPKFVCHCLDCGVVINPVYSGTSIVPFGADRGVFSKFLKNPFNPADN